MGARAGRGVENKKHFAVMNAPRNRAKNDESQPKRNAEKFVFDAQGNKDEKDEQGMGQA